MSAPVITPRAAAPARKRQARISMQYQYVTEAIDYSDLASGRVFYSLAGHPAFPVRLASEIFLRCLHLLDRPRRCCLYDPCCGAAYHLSVLAHLHPQHIRQVIASDIDENAVALARRNLALANVAGLEERIAEITDMLERYGKDSHREALASAERMRRSTLAASQEYPLETRAFCADATSAGALASQIAPRSVDIVFTDVPYGQHSQWSGGSADPTGALLEALRGLLAPGGLVAIASDKGQKASHPDYARAGQFQIGKRRVVILRVSGGV